MLVDEDCCVEIDEDCVDVRDCRVFPNIFII